MVGAGFTDTQSPLCTLRPRGATSRCYLGPPRHYMGSSTSLGCVPGAGLGSRLLGCPGLPELEGERGLLGSPQEGKELEGEVRGPFPC